MKQNLTQKLLAAHLVEGELRPGVEIAMRVDQVLVNDGSGPLIMLALEALGITRVAVEPAVAYMDHLLTQQDQHNADDHLFLKSASERFGLWYGRPGTGIAHPVHQERFGIPGTTMVGGDSHTCAAGAIAQLAIGAGGMAVALVLSGEPFRFVMPEVWGIELTGRLPEWVSAKDVILELLRRHGVAAGRNRIIEYHGDGLDQLSCMDRHVIANMGAEMGATTSLFPSDLEVRRFLRRHGREADWQPLSADPDATYDVTEVVRLDALEPLIAMPSSPGHVVPVRDVEGEEIHQSYIGSSANPGFSDIAVVAEVFAGRTVPHHVSLDINPATRRVVTSLLRGGQLVDLVQAGARIHQPGCNGCIGMGQAPATGTLSIRTVPRNFPGRSGTQEDRVCLASPETAAASALSGVITDPRRLARRSPRPPEPDDLDTGDDDLQTPLSPKVAAAVQIRHGGDIVPLPETDPLPTDLRLPVLIVAGDDVSTDEILPAGSRVMPLWSSVPRMSEFAFEGIDPSYPRRAAELPQGQGHAVVAGYNYGQGSSREHAALAPRTLGLRLVLARSIARIHWENLVNYGVVPLTFADPDDLSGIAEDHVLEVQDLPGQLRHGRTVDMTDLTTGRGISAEHELSGRQVEVVIAGGIIRHLRGGHRRTPDSTPHPG